MNKATSTQIHETFLAAGWSKHSAEWAALSAVGSVAAAQEVVAAAANLPDAIRVILAKNGRSTSGAAMLAAFTEAAEIQSLTAMDYCKKLPDSFKTMQALVYIDANGQHLMSSKDAREKMVDALAEMDQHINTARPIRAADRVPVLGASMGDPLADAAWAARRASAAARAQK